MKLIDTQCPHCGANMRYAEDKKQVNCEFCGATLIIDDETHNLRMSNGEEFGYQFEKGRQRAQAENNTGTSQTVSAQSIPAQPKKRKTWLWVLGWIFIFPVPLTIILLKKPNMTKKVKYILIAAAWIVYILLMVAGMINNANDKKSTNDFKSAKTTVATISSEETTIETTTAPATTVPITTKPTTAPTTAKPTEAAAPIQITEYTNVVAAGTNAHLAIKGAPNTEYSISVHYASGDSTAAGLETKTSDGDGNVVWEWEVGTNTAKGVHSITVRGGGSTESVSFEVI